MLNYIIKTSLNFRVLVLIFGLTLLLFGAYVVKTTPIDVFPDLTAPTVTVMTQAPGMAPEELELMATFPLETALNGSGNIRRVRSLTSEGMSTIWVEFQWGEDIYRARQIVSERLQTVTLPEGVEKPQMGPISSIMGEVMFLAVTSESMSSMELRKLVDTQIVRRLQAIPGVSKAAPVGGDVIQYSIEVDPLLMARYQLNIDQLLDIMNGASKNSAAGFQLDMGQEYLVRGLGRAESVDDLSHVVVKVQGGIPLTLSDVATIKIEPRPKRGTASYNAKEAIVISMQKQPGINTLLLTEQIEEVLEELRATLPDSVSISEDSFRQATFIERAVYNISKALRDGAILVIVILFFFLGSFRTTLISGVAIPLSLLGGVLVLSYFGLTINTMTLGGFTIAIGALVDDAIIDVENVFRRLKLEQLLPLDQRRSPLQVIFHASSEVRSAIFFATLIIILVFIPIFFLPGVEGRLLRPLGLAYVSALLASLLVSLTVTPVLCYYLLTREKVLASSEPAFARTLKNGYKRLLSSCMKHPKIIYGLTIVLVVMACLCVPFFGKSFLPEFNEGSLTLFLASPPGTLIKDSDAIGTDIEKKLLEFPEVVSTLRRTGRGDLDEHGMGVHASEIEVVMKQGRPQEELLQLMRTSTSSVPGVNVSFGQPISHRIDHMISGSKTNLAIKIFGPDLAVLRDLSRQVMAKVEPIGEVVDLSNQEQSVIPQILIDFDDSSMAKMGLQPATLARSVEALFQGTLAGEMVKDGLVSQVMIKFPEELRTFRKQIPDLPIMLNNGQIINLGDVAKVREDLGPSLIRRENVQRLAVLTANISSTDKTGVGEKVWQAIHEIDFPNGYYATLEGQFEEASKSLRTLSILTVLVLLGIYILLFSAFRNHIHTLIVLTNLPLALIGGIFALCIGSKILSIASMVGFITLFGIATRNGVLLVTHYQHLVENEGKQKRDAVVTGSIERLLPILMTALTAGLALVPLVFHGAEPGNEIQSPMAEVILGGLVSSTLLNMILVPLLFMKWGYRSKAKKSQAREVV
ncbi:MAG: CusA/CzcA family heavy metal efflux RND transporter [Acidobacteria bacterium]|nr:MAG: CusA/CzcA family heavy metal efflux RND transporter [Acidobacteriota bacterium]